jgi:iron(III) transport system permease protein
MIAIILVLPFVALVATSLVPAYGVALTATSITFDNFIEVLFRQDATKRAFMNSGILAVTAAFVLAIISLGLGYFIVWGKSKLAGLLSGLAEIPYSLPGVVLSIAMILVFLKPLPFLKFSLYGTLWIILAAYLSRFLSLCLRPVIAGFQQLDLQLEEAARVCGSGFYMRLYTITAPMLGPVATAGAILVFMTAVNELTVSALLWSAGHETLGVIVFNLDDGGYTVLASAVAVIIVLTVLLLMLFTQALSPFLPAGVLPWSDRTTR